MKPKIKKPLIYVLSTALVLSLSTTAAFADNNTKTTTKEKVATKIEMPQLDLESEAVILYDMKLNRIVYEKNQDKKTPTASLAKIMTLAVASDALDKGKVKNKDLVLVSEKAWKTGGSKMFIEVGRQVPFEELFKGVAVVSGNDAAVAIAEHVSGSTDAYVKEMNKKAKSLNMKNTKFETVNGLPLGDKMDISTPRDLGLLSVDYLKNHRENLKIHSMESYSFDTGRGVIEQKNRNPLLGAYKSADGLKTGWIDGHYNLIGTAERGGVRLVAVLMTAPSVKARENDAKKIMDYGFAQYDTLVFNKKGEVVEKLPVYKAKGITKTEVVYKKDIEITVHKQDQEKLKQEIVMPEHITGGKEKGDIIGKKNIYLGKKLVASGNIVLTEDLPKANILTSMFDSIALTVKWITSKIF